MRAPENYSYVKNVNEEKVVVKGIKTQMTAQRMRQRNKFGDGIEQEWTFKSIKGKITGHPQVLKLLSSWTCRIQDKKKINV